MEATEEKENRNFPKEKGEVLVDGVPYLMLISDNSVMFQGEKGIWGFDRTAMRSIRLSGDEKEWVFAYAAGGELKSVKVKPNGKWWMEGDDLTHQRGEKYEGPFPADLAAIPRLLKEFTDTEEYRRVLSDSI
jgi:hypothetical protein